MLEETSQTIQLSEPSDQQSCKSLEALEAEITTLAGHINAAEYRFLKLIAEFDEKRGWEGEGIRSLSHWLNWRCGMSLMMAREKVRVARALGNLPQIETAFGKGEISYSKVRAMTRVATPENESLLLQVAQHGTASHIEKLVRKYRGYKQSSKSAEDKEDLSWCPEKKLQWYQDENGSLVFSGRLPAEEGAILVKAIEKIMDDLYQEQIEKKQQQRMEELYGDHDSNGGDSKESVSAGTSYLETLSNPSGPAGLVSAETLSQNTFSKENMTEPSDEPLPEYSERSANALVRMSEAVLSCEAPLSGTGAGDKHHLLIHINENAAHADFRINGRALHFLDSLDQQHFLEAEVVKRLACDAAITTIIEDDDGHPLNVGRKSRVIPPAIKRALHVRDGGCRYPGCCQSRWIDAHHIEHWVDGGETRLDNLVTLCRYHHTQLHKGEYCIHVQGNREQQMLFVLADNRVLPVTYFPQFEAGQHSPAQLEEEHLRLGLEIDDCTTECKWSGDTIDYEQTIDGLIVHDNAQAKTTLSVS